MDNKDLNLSVNSYGNKRNTTSNANENDNNNDKEYNNISNNNEWNCLCASQWNF